MILSVNLLLILFSLAEQTKNLSAARFIAGGYPVKIEEYPFMVSVENSTFVICAGVILSPNFVITAAHCIIQDKGLLIKAGTHDISKNGTIGRVEHITIHPLHNGDLYDVALLELEEPLEFTSRISNVTLPSFSNKIEVSRGISLGWGWTQNPKDDPNILRAINLEVEEVCRDNTKSTFCVNNRVGNVCRGDSGGPFVSNGVLYGIVSSGPVPCGNGLPATMVRIPFLVDWIKSHTKIS